MTFFSYVFGSVFAALGVMAFDAENIVASVFFFVVWAVFAVVVAAVDGADDESVDGSLEEAVENMNLLADYLITRDVNLRHIHDKDESRELHLRANEIWEVLPDSIKKKVFLKEQRLRGEEFIDTDMYFKKSDDWSEDGHS